MHDDNESPYRCPLCLIRPSLCMVDALTNKHIVAKARIENMEDTKGEWKTFEIPFVYDNDKEIDLDLLDANGYSLTVCFSSSIDGATFEGAIGSTLLIDKVRIECEEEAE